MSQIRRAELADARAIAEIYAPFVSEQATSFEVIPPDEDEIARRIGHYRSRYPWLVYESASRVLGYAYASPHRERLAYQWCVEVSVYVDPVAHRRGTGRALYTALFDILRRQGYVNAYAGITLPNPGSMRLHESMGFQLAGIFVRIGFKLDAWHDVAWLGLRLLDDPRPLPDPRPADDAFDDPDVNRVLAECAGTVR